MRKIICFVIVFLSVLDVCGQSIDLLVEGRKWSVLSQSGGPISYRRTETRLLKGDTLIGNFVYKKVYNIQDRNSAPTYLAGVRQEGDRCYLLNPSISSQEVLQFDFSLGSGDRFGVRESTFRVTESRDTLLSGEAFKRKCIVVHVEIGGEVHPALQDIWIEGIGSLSTGVGDVPFVGPSGTPFSFLLCCSNPASSPFFVNGAYGTCYIDNDLLSEGRKWSVLRIPKNPLSQRSTEIKLIKGDTLINGKSSPTCPLRPIQSDPLYPI